jgi:acetylornithine deacetylase
MYELEDDQKKVLDSIRDDEVISLAKDLIKIKSFKTEESECARFLAKFMEENGLEAELQEVEDGRLQVIGRLKGTGDGPTLMFNGHLDIDPLPLGLKRDPWKPVIQDGKLYGAGILNMKAGVTAMTMAAIALKKAKIDLRGNILVAGVVGELQGGVGTVHLLKSGISADMAVVTEPYGKDNLMTTHAGVCEFAIHTYGIAKHVSEKEKGVSAIEKMTKVIEAINNVKLTHKPFPKMPGLPRFVIGSIIGGLGEDYKLNGPNFVPDICTILVDVRFVPGQTPESIKSDFERAIEELRKRDPQLRYRIETPPDARWKVCRVTMMPTDVPESEYVVQSVIRSHKAVTGKDMNQVGAILPWSYAGNDTAHLWQAGIPCCLYGPGGDYLPEQAVPLDELLTVTRVLALTGVDICTKTRKELGLNK